MRTKETAPTTHELKTLPPYFQAVIDGRKNFELRIDDRDYKVGDNLLLKEWNGKEYTKRKTIRHISYILRDCPRYGLQEGFCILGF